MDILKISELLFVIEELLGDEPNDSASEDDKEYYHTHRELFIVDKSVMLCTMSSELEIPTPTNMI
jgi:CBS domain containing-hemolysin-like protein